MAMTSSEELPLIYLHHFYGIVGVVVRQPDRRSFRVGDHVEVCENSSIRTDKESATRPGNLPVVTVGLNQNNCG